MTYQQSLSTMRALRTMIGKRLSTIDDATLHRIPTGFNGNLHWQIGHLAVTPALLTFKLSGLDMPVPGPMVEAFAKGSAPSAASAAFSRESVQQELFSVLDAIEEAFINNRFTNFSPYQTSAGVPLNNADEALAFAAVHDGIHLGYTLALARVLSA